MRRIGGLVLAAVVPLLLSMATPSSADQLTFEMVNRATNTYLVAQNGRLVASRTAGPAAVWILEPVNNQGAVRIRSAATGGYLNMQNGALQVGPVQPGGQSAMWIVQRVANPYALLLNAAYPGVYVNVQNGSVTASRIQPGAQSAMWQALPANQARAAPPARTMPGRQAAGRVAAAPSIPANQLVDMVIVNRSSGPLNVFVDDGGGHVAFVVMLPPNEGVDQPSRIGYLWRLAQNNQWVAAYKAGSAAKQIINYPQQ